MEGHSADPSAVLCQGGQEHEEKVRQCDLGRGQGEGEPQTVSASQHGEHHGLQELGQQCPQEHTRQEGQQPHVDGLPGEEPGDVPVGDAQEHVDAEFPAALL